MRLPGSAGHRRQVAVVVAAIAVVATGMALAGDSAPTGAVTAGDCLVTGTYPAGETGEPDPVENVIVVSMDTLRADRLDVHAGDRYYSRERIVSPDIADFAANSAVFENAVTPVPWTLPAHVSLFTSTYPRTHRVMDQGMRMPDRFVTLAEVFADNGYATAGFHGRGHLSTEFGMAQGFDTYTSTYEREPAYSFMSAFPGAASWLADHRDERSFVFVHGYDPHGPYRADQPYDRFYADNHTGPMEAALDQDFPNNSSWRVNTVNGTPTLVWENGSSTALDADDIDDVRDAYDSGVRHTDALFGRFIDDLKERGIYDDSLIVVLGDHGENLGAHGFTKNPRNPRFGHWYIWDHTAHVPLIIHHPGMDGQRLAAPATLLDVAPTLYDLQDVDVGNATAARMQGRSLLGLLRGGDVDDRYVLTESDDMNDTAIRGERWKLIRRGEGEDMLYRVDGGPTERVPITEHPGTHQDLLDRVRCWEQAVPGPETMSSADSNLTDELRERLEDLGYAG